MVEYCFRLRSMPAGPRDVSNVESTLSSSFSGKHSARLDGGKIYISTNANIASVIKTLKVIGYEIAT